MVKKQDDLLLSAGRQLMFAEENAINAANLRRGGFPEAAAGYALAARTHRAQARQFARLALAEQNKRQK